MRVLITGGAGFLGSALANRLVGDGQDVRVLDDLSVGDRARLAPDVAFVTGDIRDIPKLWTLLRGVDCVYHLAARVSVPESLLYPVEYNDTNVGGTVSLLTAMRDAQVRRLIFASSGAVYGEQHTVAVLEDAPLRPDTPYAVSKAASEQYVRAIGNLWGIETVVLRVFNAYGPNQSLPPSHAPVMPRFLRQAVTGGSLVIFGDGRQVRDFVYVDDVVDALVAAGRESAVAGKTMNIGSGVGVSISGLVDAIEEVVGRDVHSLINTDSDGGISRLVADISLAGEALSYTAKTGILEGIRTTLERDRRFAGKSTAF